MDSYAQVSQVQTEQLKKETPEELRRRARSEMEQSRREHFMQLAAYNMAGGQTLEEQREEELRNRLQEQRELNEQLLTNAQNQLGKAGARAAATGSPRQEQAPAQQTYKQKREQTRRTKAAQKMSGNSKADYVSYGMVERLRDMEERKKDAGARIDEAVSQGRMEMAGLKAFCQGYHKNKNGEPATDSDRYAKEEDDAMIDSFRTGNPETVKPYLEKFSSEMIQAHITSDMFAPAYMEAHAAEMKELTEKASYIKELMGNEAYKSFFEEMPGPVRILLDAKLDVMEKFSDVLKDNWRSKGVDTAQNGKYGTDGETPDEELKSHQEALAGSLKQYRRAEREAYDLAADKQINKLMADSDARKGNVENANVKFHSYMASGAAGKMLYMQEVIAANPDAYRQYGPVIDSMYQKVYRLLDVQGDVQLRKEAYQATRADYGNYDFFEQGMRERMLEHQREDEMLTAQVATYVNMMEHFLEGKELSEAGMALVSGDEAMMKAEEQKSIRDRSAADPVASKMAEQIRELVTSKDNALRGYADAINEAGVDDRILRVFSKGYRVDEKGRPLTAEDKRNQEADDQMIQDYLSNDVEKRAPYLQKIVREITEASITEDVLDPEYQAEHMAELWQLSKKMTVMENAMKDPVNKPFFDAMPALDKQLFEARWNMCGSLGWVLQTTADLKGVNFQFGTYEGRSAEGVGLEEINAGAREAFKADLQASNKRYASEQLKDLDTRLENAIHGKAFEKAGVDGRMLKSFSRGYRLDRDGKPLTEEDAKNKKADDQMIQNYLSQDISKREPYLKQFVREITEARITKDILDPVYQIEHAAEINKLGRQLTYIENAMREPINKPFFDRMPPTERELFEAKQHMGDIIPSLMAAVWNPRRMNCNDGQYLNGEMSEQERELMETLRLQFQSDFEERLQEGGRRFASAQIRDMALGAHNALRGYDEAADKAHVDKRILHTFCQGYHVDGNGNPLTEEDAKKKKEDDEMITAYLSNKYDQREPYLEQFTRTIMDARITKDMLDPEYQLEHATELSKLSGRLTYMVDIMKDSANRPFFDRMPSADKQIFEAKMAMCVPLGSLLTAAGQMAGLDFVDGTDLGKLPDDARPEMEASMAVYREQFLQALAPLEMLGQV